MAPRHLKAIQQTGNDLVAAYDPHDSVGIIDSYFPEADFFTNFERFERHIFKQNTNDETRLDYITVCSPNYLHDTHIRLGLQNDCDVICEKPIVLTSKHLDYLETLENEMGNRVYTVMQLRYHPALMELKSKLSNASVSTDTQSSINSNKHASMHSNIQSNKQETHARTRHKVELKYITPRGKWYHTSWKGDVEKSGGICTNIGIHLFDLLLWLYGDVQSFEIKHSDENKAAGRLILKEADVEWFLSIDKNDLPEETVLNKKISYRSLISDGEQIEFSDGFTDLHTKVYQEILDGRGLGIKDARPSIELVEKLRM